MTRRGALAGHGGATSLISFVAIPSLAAGIPRTINRVDSKVAKKDFFLHTLQNNWQSTISPANSEDEKGVDPASNALRRRILLE
jgi:hypothetical protein